MKKTILCIILLLVVCGSLAAKSVKTSKGGMLRQVLGESALVVKDIKVKGVINASDLEEINRISKEGNLRKVDLSKAEFDDYGAISSGTFDGSLLEEITFGWINEIDGPATFKNMPNLCSVKFDGFVGFIYSDAIFQSCPKLKEITFNGSIFCANSESLCDDCPELERIVFNGALGDVNFCKPHNCPMFNGYEVHGAVGLSRYPEWIKSNLTDMPKSKLVRLKQLEEDTKLWTDGHVKASDYIKKILVVDVFYDIACGYSLANMRDDAIRTLEISIKHGYDNYSHMKCDKDLDNIRNDERFKSLHESIREKGDKLFILQHSSPYAKDDKDITFTYASPSDENLKRVRSYFNLDSIAGSGDEISQIKNILYWLHDAIPHDGQHGIPGKERNSICIYEACKAEGVGANCRGLAIVLSELYLAMGWPSRFVTCESKAYDADPDCHVINMVWSKQLGKWIWVDPTFAAYVSDENGQLLGIGEVRQRLIDGRPLVLNEDANWNHKSKETKEHYLDSYMAKNLYVLSAYQDNTFGCERKSTYITLVPSGFNYRDNANTTTDEAKFFAAPVTK